MWIKENNLPYRIELWMSKRMLETGIKSVFNFCKFLRTSSRVETYYWTTIATPVLAFYWKTCVNNALVKSSVLGFTNYRATEQVSACNLVSPYGDLRAKIQIIWELILLSHIGSQPLTDTHTHTHTHTSADEIYTYDRGQFLYWNPVVDFGGGNGVEGILQCAPPFPNLCS